MGEFLVLWWVAIDKRVPLPYNDPKFGFHMKKKQTDESGLI